RARAEAETADLVVINHALLLADVEVGGGLLPEFDHLVIDEAHHLEEAATRGLRQEVDGPGLIALLERLARRDDAGRMDGLLEELQRQPHLGASGEAFTEAQPKALAAAAHGRELFRIADVWVAARLGEAERREESVRITPAMRGDAEWVHIGMPAENTVTALAALDASLRRAVGGVREWLGGEEPDQRIRELEMIRGRLDAAMRLLDEALMRPDSNRVYWFSQVSRAENLLLRAAPINVGTLLRERVYAERRSTVFTSATLAVGGTFDYFSSRVGLPGDRLSCVIIVRLPFPVPTDPIYAARADRVRDPFSQLALPQAALRLKQGFGRLIRRSTDRGAVAILDNRILGRDYGKAFL